MTLYRYEKKLSENTLCFKTKSDVSKPELRQYFKKLYGIEPKRISTIRFMGKVELGMKGYKKTAAYKKIYMELNEKVDPKLRLVDGEELPPANPEKK